MKYISSIFNFRYIIVEIHLFGSHLNIWKLSLFYQIVMVLLESTVGNVSA